MQSYSIKDLENLLDLIPYEIWIKDEAGKHIYMNKLGCEKVGLTKDEIIGKTDYEIRDYNMAKNCVVTDIELLNGKNRVIAEEYVETETEHIYYKVEKFKMDSENLYGGIALEKSTAKEIQNEVESSINKYLSSNKEEEKYDDFTEEIIESLKSFLKCSNIDIFRYNKKNKTFNRYRAKNLNTNLIIEIDEYLENVINVSGTNVEVEKLLKDKLEINNKNEQTIIQVIKINKEIEGLVIISYPKFSEHAYFRDREAIEGICKKIFIALKEKDNSIKRLSQNDIVKSYMELEALKDDFFSNVSHEFRTPLNIILSTVQLMGQQLDTGEENREIYKSHLKNLKQNSYRILRLLNNTLDIVRIKNNIEIINLSKCNIVEVVEDIVTSAIPHVESYGKNIIFDTNEEEVLLFCDIDKIERAILNLISNAVKFSNENSIIDINVNVNREQSKLFVSVKNYGKNIDNEFIEKIFNKYNQEESLHTRKNEGSGQGLFITRRIIEMHYGEMWIDNSIEGINEFKFYIPINIMESDKEGTPYIDKYSRCEKCAIEFSGI